LATPDYELLNPTRTELWGRVIARVLLIEGVIVGVL
jgi:hypothetical protein